MEPMTGLRPPPGGRVPTIWPPRPFIMITARSRPRTWSAAREAGVNNCIVKPFNAADAEEPRSIRSSRTWRRRQRRRAFTQSASIFFVAFRPGSPAPSTSPNGRAAQKRGCHPGMTEILRRPLVRGASSSPAPASARGADVRTTPLPRPVELILWPRACSGMDAAGEEKDNLIPRASAAVRSRTVAPNPRSPARKSSVNRRRPQRSAASAMARSIDQPVRLTVEDHTRHFSSR